MLLVEDIEIPHLKVLVEKFAHEYRLYKDPRRARGECVETSYEFLRFLHAHGYVGNFQNIDWEIEGSKVVDGPRLPLEIESLFWDNGFGGHTAVLVDGYYVDFTARQFAREGRRIPFPLIWKYPKEEQRHAG